MGSVNLVGTVTLDVTARVGGDQRKVRLGGIVHAARSLWAMGVPYNLYFVGPSYLADLVQDYINKFGAERCVQIGTITGAPGCLLIDDVLESGDQGYDYLLKYSERIAWIDGQSVLDRTLPTLMVPHGASLADWCRCSGVDPSVTFLELTALSDEEAELVDQFQIVSTSTSCKSAFRRLFDQSGRNPMLAGSHAYILKENRGGVTLWTSGSHFECGADLRCKTENSVGVGDAFAAAFMVSGWMGDPRGALAKATAVASSYAATTYPDKFKSLCEERLSSAACSELVRVPWGSRPGIKIYLAAPDFDCVDTSLLNAIQAALEYHNFSVLRPVVENGQLDDAASWEERRAVGASDLKLLEQCDLLVAVPLYEDSGTYIEIGMAQSRELPVIYFDLHRQCKNAMVAMSATDIVDNIESLVVAVYKQAALALCRREG